MDVRKVFRTVSSKLLADFNISAEINHQGNKGSFRETALRDFLDAGRLPQKYGIGGGEIVGPARNVSRQSDLVVFDRMNGLALLFNESVQVYPIESVYGVVEVKSGLSKGELFKALENIKSVKALTPKESIVQKAGPGISMCYGRPAPFGMVFAYSLAGNSLDSLCENLKEWESENLPEHWPNLIAVLGEGCIQHYGKGAKKCFANQDIQKSCYPVSLSYRQDTLFQFYIALLDLCAGTHLGPPELSRYYDPAEQMGAYVVRNHDRVQRTGTANDNAVYRFNLPFIEKLVGWCGTRGKVRQKDLFIRQLGTVPEGMDDALLEYEVYHYDPDQLPGLHEVKNPILRTSTGVHPNGRLLMPSHWIEIDGEVYYFSWAYVSDNDIEKIPGKTGDDL